MGYDPRGIANYLLDYADKKSRPVTHMALQKILYFCHGWFLAKHNKPLLSEPAEAWSHGPVYKSVYRSFKAAKRESISFRAKALNFGSGKSEIVVSPLDEEASQFIENIFDVYSQYTAAQLRNMTHEIDGPWHQVCEKAKGKAVPGMRIPDALIRHCFLEGKTGLTQQ